MGTARVHEGIRQMRFEGLLEQQTRGEITQEEAATVLGVSVRTFQRWAARYEEDGAEGLKDGRLNRPSPKRSPREELERMLGLFRDQYADFTVKHFHEQLVKRHNYFLGYTVTKLALHAAGLVQPAKKRSAHRKKRPRRPVRGTMLHQDGSRHAWLERQPQLDLIVTMDDATSEILSMFLVKEEGTASTFRALREVISEHGLFCELYTDRGAHYFYTSEAGTVSKTQLTQVGRALKQLGIRQIGARSPEARGRSERMFRTLQDRVPKELRLAGITTMEAANVWLKAHISEHNARFAVEPEQDGSMFVADRDGAYREILCVQEERQVGNDNTVSWNGRRLQIPESPLRPHFVKATARIHEYPDGTLSVFWGPHRLAQFTADGTPIGVAPTTPSVAPCSGPSRTSPDGRAKSASLTVPARVAQDIARVGTKKRAKGRTKKRSDAQKPAQLRNLARKKAA
jgi:transposase